MPNGQTDSYEDFEKRWGIPPATVPEPGKPVPEGPKLVPESPKPVPAEAKAVPGSYEEFERKWGLAPEKPAAAAPPTDFTGHLQENRHLDFVDRVLRPEKYPVIQNEDGSTSTHLMASADNLAYPTIVRKPGEDKLTKLSPEEAHKYALESGEHIRFSTPQEAAQFAEGGYKTAAEQLRPEVSAAPPSAYPLAPPPASHAPAHADWENPLGTIASKIGLGFKSGLSGLAHLQSTLSGGEGTPVGKFFKDLGDALSVPPEKVGTDLASKILAGLGSAPIGVLEYGIANLMGGPAGIGMLQVAEAQPGLWNKLKAFVGGFALGKAFQITGGLPRVARIPAMGAIGGTQAALEGGDIKDATAGAVTMMILATPGGRELEKHVVNDTKPANISEENWAPIKSVIEQTQGLSPEDFQTRMEQYRQEWEAEHLRPEEKARRAPAPTREEAQAQVNEILRSYREGEEQPVLAENLPEEVLEAVRQGKPLSPDLNERLINALVGERPRPIGPLPERPQPMPTAGAATRIGATAPGAAEAPPGVSPLPPGAAAPGAGMVSKGLPAAAPAGRQNEIIRGALPPEPAPAPPRVPPAMPEPPAGAPALPGGQTVAVSPIPGEAERPRRGPLAPPPGAEQPMGTAGAGAARVVEAAEAAPAPPAPTLAPGEIAPPEPPGAAVESRPAPPGRLFSLEDEATLARGLTTADIRKRVGDFGTVSEIPAERLHGGNQRAWRIDTKGGQMIGVFESRDGSLEMRVGETLGPEYEELGMRPEAGRIRGAYRPMSFGGLVELARDVGPRTVDHELWHHIEQWLLTDKERAALARDFGPNEEVRARAYSEWSPKEAPNTIFQKIKDFFQRILKSITGYMSGEDVFAKARTGELFGREPRERVLEPERRFEVAGAEEERRPWDMVGGITGKVTGNLEQAQAHYRGVKDWLSAMFWPTRRTEEGRWTHEKIAGRQAETAKEQIRMNREFQQYIPQTNFADPRTIEFLRLYESPDFKPEDITDPTFKAFGEFYRAEERRQMANIHELGIDLNDLSNYIDHLWMSSEKLNQIKQALVSERGKSIQGPQYFRLLRTVSSIPAGIEAGLQPRYNSLAETVMAGRAAHESFIGAQRAIKDVKDAGRLKVVTSLDKAPEGWRKLPGAYGEVWTKVDRRAMQAIPEIADTETMPLGGGPERAGYEDIPALKGWMRVGYRVAPEDVVTQFENFASRGWSGKAPFEVYQNALFGVRHLQMALSAWHLTFEGINAMASRAWMGLADTVGGIFQGDVRRLGAGLGKLVTAPAALPLYIRKGLEFDRALMNPKYADPDVVDIANILAGGARVASETNLKNLLGGHLREAGEAFRAAQPFRAAGGLLRTASSGLMDFIVPQGKNGQIYNEYFREMERFTRQMGREATQEEARRIAYEVREHADNVWGAVARDNVNVGATARSLFSFWLQFPRFNIGSAKLLARDISGAKGVLRQAVQFARGMPVESLKIEDRLALQYTTGLLFSVGLMGGLMHWAFTGKPPEKMKDFYYPATGETLPNGAEERLQLPSYLKDAYGLVKHPVRVITAKEATFIHVLDDFIANKDYWGEQIYDPYGSWREFAQNIGKYLGRQATPFIVQTYLRGAEQTPGRAGLSFMGIRPVPREIANTPAMGVMDHYNELMRASTTTKEGAELKRLKADLMKLARAGDEAGFLDMANTAREEGRITQRQIEEVAKESQEPAGLSRFRRLPLEWKLRTLAVASDFEKEQWLPYFLKSIITESEQRPENLVKNRELLMNALDALGFPESAAFVQALEIPEEGGRRPLGELGIPRPAPEIPDLERADTEVARAMAANLAKLTGEPRRRRGPLPSPPRHRLEFLGL